MQIREGMSANSADSGTVIAQNYYPIAASTAGQINTDMPLLAGRPNWFTVYNGTSHSIERRYESLHSHYAVIYHTPIGDI